MIESSYFGLSVIFQRGWCRRRACAHAPGFAFFEEKVLRTVCAGRLVRVWALVCPCLPVGHFVYWQGEVRLVHVPGVALHIPGVALHVPGVALPIFSAPCDGTLRRTPIYHLSRVRLR